MSTDYPASLTNVLRFILFFYEQIARFFFILTTNALRDQKLESRKSAAIKM